MTMTAQRVQPISEIVTNGGNLAAASMTAQIADTGTISNTVTAASATGGTVTCT